MSSRPLALVLAASLSGALVACAADTEDAVTTVSSELVTTMDISAGGGRACATLSSGETKCWGRESWWLMRKPGESELQKGRFSAPRTVELVPVTGYRTLEALKGARSFTPTKQENGFCYQAGGQVHCAGMFGLFDIQRHRLDVDARQVAVGGWHGCAVTNAGTVTCWGGNGWGQIDQKKPNVVATPTEITALGSDVKSIAAGLKHTCALMNDGSVRCWGAKYSSSVLGGVTADEGFALYAENKPVRVDDLPPDVVSLVAAGYQTCALTGSGDVRCWGQVDPRVFGGQPWVFDRRPQIALPAGVRPVQISAGWAHGCALSDAGKVYCWGYLYAPDGFGTFDGAAPAVVPGFDDVKKIASGDSFVCGLERSGVVKCFGEDVGKWWTSTEPGRAARTVPGP